MKREKKLMGCPAWLGLSDDRTSFVMLEDRAETVRYIFKLSVAGFGAYSIAKKLSANRTPTFKVGGKWDQSVVFNILSNRATFGEYIPGKYRKRNRPQVSGEAVPDYYPAVIDENVFESAQAARRKNWSLGRGRKGKLITNLFAGRANCLYCGSAMKFVRNGQAKSLVCDGVSNRSSCLRYGWSYDDFETAFLSLVMKDQQINPLFSGQLSQLRFAVERKSEDDIYSARLEFSEQLKDGAIQQICIASAGIDPPASVKNFIVKDHPNRIFTVALSNGYLATGRPVPAARNVSVNPTIVSHVLGLSLRQSELVALLAEGDSLAIAASTLRMKLETARWHLRQIFASKKIHSQLELIELAINLCSPEKT
jgi:DNA-binding CsgD family transcriptional regulator